jgi:methylenetetrahydrofolate dehydrogenase (NADP+)/methenyltetrahydrofolate cyclohydrolase
VGAQILDGRSLAAEIRAQLSEEVKELLGKDIRPRIDFIVASQDPASLAYVRMKRKWAEEIGMVSGAHYIDEQTTQASLLQKVLELNEDPSVHGILVQHPLPGHLDEQEILLALGEKKDVDGMTPQSLGRLASDMPGFRCATALGIITLLERYGVPIEGKQALVIGRSIIVGKPTALLLLQKNATVTIAHSKTVDLPEICRGADIVVVGVGQPQMVRADWIKPGAVVVDAGYNKVEGYIHDVGDVYFESVSQVASWITPVPGGVGPMTVASLLRNTLEAAFLASGLKTIPGFAW